MSPDRERCVCARCCCDRGGQHCRHRGCAPCLGQGFAVVVCSSCSTVLRYTTPAEVAAVRAGTPIDLAAACPHCAPGPVPAAA